MNFSQIFQKVITDWLRGTPTTPPTSLLIGLSTANPLMNGAGVVEPPSPNGYARQAITFGAEVFVNGTGSTVKNSAPIVFGPVTNADWNPITHVCVYSQSGQLLLQGALASPTVITVGGSLPIAIDALQFLVR